MPSVTVKRSICPPLWHSEAEGFKYFPKKAEYRMDSLRKLLKTEFPEVKERILNGKAPLGYYIAEGVTDAYPLYESAPSEYELVGKNKFRMYRDECDLVLDIKCSASSSVLFSFEYMLMAPGAAITLKNGKLGMRDIQDAMLSGYFGEIYEKELERYRVSVTEDGYTVRIARESYEICDTAPLKLRIVIDGVSWKNEEEPTVTLGKGHASPGQYGWLIPTK